MWGKLVSWVLGIFALVWIILSVVGFWHTGQVQKTQDAVDRINSRHITLDDVMGKHLPPQPDQKLNDSTVAGIDANHNGIRDDVELTIFQKYPNSAKLRAAELQYAQALQSELTDVFDSKTLVAVLKREDSAYFCLSEVGKGTAFADVKNKEVRDFVLNTDLRRKLDSNNYSSYMTTYSLPDAKNGCDIDVAKLAD